MIHFLFILSTCVPDHFWTNYQGDNRFETALLMPSLPSALDIGALVVFMVHFEKPNHWLTWFAHKKTAVIHLGFSFCFSRRCNLLVKNEKFPNIFTQIDGTQDQIIGLTLLMSTLLNRSIGELTLQSQCSVLLFKELLESFGTCIWHTFRTCIAQCRMTTTVSLFEILILAWVYPRGRRWRWTKI